MKMTIISAMDDNRLIGANNDLPWRLPADLKHFKATTLGHAMVMGSATWKSFGRRPLPGRPHVIVSSQPSTLCIDTSKCGSDVTGVTDLDLALSIAESRARKAGQDEYFVIGGASIYEQVIDRADRMILTRVHGTWEGDRYFPEIGPNWEADFLRPDTELLESNGINYSILDYRRA